MSKTYNLLLSHGEGAGVNVVIDVRLRQIKYNIKGNPITAFLKRSVGNIVRARTIFT